MNSGKFCRSNFVCLSDQKLLVAPDPQIVFTEEFTRIQLNQFKPTYYGSVQNGYCLKTLGENRSPIRNTLTPELWN